MTNVTKTRWPDTGKTRSVILEGLKTKMPQQRITFARPIPQLTRCHARTQRRRRNRHSALQPLLQPVCGRQSAPFTNLLNPHRTCKHSTINFSWTLRALGKSGKTLSNKCSYQRRLAFRQQVTKCPKIHAEDANLQSTPYFKTMLHLLHSIFIVRHRRP